MTTCKKCNSGILKRLDNYKYHEVHECVNCFALTSTKLRDCICQFGYNVVVQEHLEYGSSRLFYQCRKCGYADRSKQLPMKQYSEKIDDAFNEQLFENYKEYANQESVEIGERFKIFGQLRYHKYYEYLLTEEWRNLRERVFARDNGVCVICKINQAKEVHHLHYRTLYKETLDDLQSVCTSCHRDIHKILFVSQLK